MVGRSPDGRSLRFVPLSCRSWKCPKCAERKAWHWRFLIPKGEPTRWMTLSCNAKAFPTPASALLAFKKAFPVLVRRIRQRATEFEYCAVYERHKNGYPHLHVAFRGTFIPQRWLSQQWRQLANSPIVDIRAIPNQRALTHYLTKYLVKNALHTATEFPGLRIITVSRGFFPPVIELTLPGPYEGWTWVYLDLPPGDVADMLAVDLGATIESFSPDNSLSFTMPDHLPPPPDNDHRTLALWDLLEGTDQCKHSTTSNRHSPQTEQALLSFATIPF